MLRRIVYSGWCVCGHHYNQHHLMCLMRQEAIDIVGAPSLPGECLAYGCNEDWDGLDNEGNPHCVDGYIDRDDPERICYA